MPRAVTFDLGGTWIHWPDWDDAAPLRWSTAYGTLLDREPDRNWPEREVFASAMRTAELAHWARVDAENWSGPATSVVTESFRTLGIHGDTNAVLAVMDGYAAAVSGWAMVYPDSRETLSILRRRGYRLGLLSNTWWAAAWHNADLAAHGLAPFFDTVVYTSDLTFSKPHPFVFEETARRLDAPVDACVMVGDRPVDDIAGAMSVGMRGVWKRKGMIQDLPESVEPNAIIEAVSEMGPLLMAWGGN